MTREEAQKRFETARQKKRDCLTRLEKNMKEEYEKRTGKTADYFFALWKHFPMLRWFCEMTIPVLFMLLKNLLNQYSC